GPDGVRSRRLVQLGPVGSRRQAQRRGYSPGVAGHLAGTAAAIRAESPALVRGRGAGAGALSGPARLLRVAERTAVRLESAAARAVPRHLVGVQVEGAPGWAHAADRERVHGREPGPAERSDRVRVLGAAALGH